MAVSYHPGSLNLPLGSRPPAAGFKVVDTNDPHRVKNCMLKYLWSGVVWFGGYRSIANFVYSDWCLIDIDDNYHQYPLSQAINDFCDKVHIIGLTRNHLENKDGVTCERYRIAVPWDRRITDHALYRGNMVALAEKYPALDPSTLHGAQPFFRCTEIASFNDDGYKQDVVEQRWEDRSVSGAELSRLIEANAVQYRMIGRLPKWVEAFLRNGACERRHFKTLGAAMAMVEHGLREPEIIERLNKVPISRAYRRREVEDIVRHAIKDVARRLKQDG